MPGLFSRIGSAVQTPSNTMSWTQLAAATIFVLVVIVAWRQVTHFIMKEV